MNREIKFRIFDTRNKKMITDNVCFQIALSVDGTIKAGITGDILMQFTGLKDKNEKEIYEGDILENTQGKISKVIWFQNGWYLIGLNKLNNVIYIPLDNLGVLDNKKIIGNIYENPDLPQSSE